MPKAHSIADSPPADSWELLCNESGNAVEKVDRRLDILEQAFIEGVTDFRELARRAGVSKVGLRRNYWPALEARMARHAEPDRRKIKLAEADVRAELLLEKLWKTMSTENRPSVQVQIAQEISKCHTRIESLNGIIERDVHYELYLKAINEFLEATTQLISDTNDRKLLRKFEHILNKFACHRVKRSPDKE